MISALPGDGESLIFPSGLDAVLEFDQLANGLDWLQQDSVAPLRSTIRI